MSPLPLFQVNAALLSLPVLEELHVCKNNIDELGSVSAGLGVMMHGSWWWWCMCVCVCSCVHVCMCGCASFNGVKQSIQCVLVP